MGLPREEIGNPSGLGEMEVMMHVVWAMLIYMFGTSG